MRLTERQIVEEWTARRSGSGYRNSGSFWDVYARQNAEEPKRDPGETREVGIVRENGMIGPESSVLDLGCGNGAFTRWFAERCRKAVGFDVSERAAEGARRKALEAGIENVEFRQGDWADLDLDEAGWRKAFDLVFCRMSPAVRSAETFLRMCEAARGWCVLSKPMEQEDRVIGLLLGELGIGRRSRPFGKDMEYAEALLGCWGIRPGAEKFARVRDRSAALTDAAEFYAAWIDENYGLPDGGPARVREILGRAFPDGWVDAREEITVEILFWKMA